MLCGPWNLISCGASTNLLNKMCCLPSEGFPLPRGITSTSTSGNTNTGTPPTLSQGTFTACLSSLCHCKPGGGFYHQINNPTTNSTYLVSYYKENMTKAKWIRAVRINKEILDTKIDTQHITD